MTTHRAAINHLSDKEPRLASLMSRVGPCKLPEQSHDASLYFESLATAIMSQQLSSKAASTIIGRFKTLVRPGGGALLPSDLDPHTDEALRGVGLSQAKMRGVRDLAARVSAGSLDLASLPHKSDEEVIEVLTEVRGIGRWTAEMFLMFSLARPDVLPVADLGIQKGVVKLWNLRKDPTPERMHQLMKPLRPYRSIACWYLWRLLEAPEA